MEQNRVLFCNHYIDCLYIDMFFIRFCYILYKAIKVTNIYTYFICGTIHPWDELAVGRTGNGTKHPELALGRNDHKPTLLTLAFGFHAHGLNS